MRTTVFLFFLLTHVGVSQSLTGGYMFTDGLIESKEGYYFWEVGEFIWFKYCKEKRFYGRGNFQVSNDTLTLSFDKARRQFDIASIEAKRIGGLNGLIEVDAMTSSGDPIIDLKVALVDSEIHTFTDSIGYARLDLKQPIRKDWIHFNLEGYRTIDNLINLRGHHTQAIIIIDNEIAYKEYEESSFKFVASKSVLIFEKIDRVLKFKKISKKRYLRIYHKP